MLESIKQLFHSAKAAAATPPLHVPISVANVDVADRLGTEFQPDGHYFQIKCNELYSATVSHWHVTHDPVVMVVSEFLYDGKERSLPMVVGPSLAASRGLDAPNGMLLRNIRVAGLHPYIGGQIRLTLILYRLPRGNSLRTALDVTDRALGALDFATSLVPYLDVASKVVDGVAQALGSNGPQSPVPVLGVHQEFDPDGLHPLVPGYYALVGLPAGQVVAERLHVQSDQLFEADDDGRLSPFRRADYVLWSLVQCPDRRDLPAFPFYETWEFARDEATKATPNSWDSAKINFSSLYRTMLRSPDLTDRHAKVLRDTWRVELRSEHDDAVAGANLGPGSRRDQDRDDALALLRD